MIMLGASADPELEARRIAAERHGMCLVTYYTDSYEEEEWVEEWLEEWVEVAQSVWRIGIAPLYHARSVRLEAECLEKLLNQQIEERNDGTVQED